MPRFNASELACAVAAGVPRASTTFADDDAWHVYQETWLRNFSPDEQLPPVGDHQRRIRWKAVTRQHKKMMAQLEAEGTSIAVSTAASTAPAVSFAVESNDAAEAECVSTERVPYLYSSALSSSAAASLVHVPSNKWVQQHAPLLNELEVGPPQLTPRERHASLSLRGHFAGRDNEQLVEQEDVHYTLPDSGESDAAAKRRGKRHREREEAAIFRLQLEAEDPGAKAKQAQLKEMDQLIREGKDKDRKAKIRRLLRQLNPDDEDEDEAELVAMQQRAWQLRRDEEEAEWQRQLEQDPALRARIEAAAAERKREREQMPPPAPRPPPPPPSPSRPPWPPPTSKPKRPPSPPPPMPRPPTSTPTKPHYQWDERLQQTLVIDPPPGKWVQFDGWPAPKGHWTTELTTEHGTKWYLHHGERVDRPPGDTRWPSWAFPNPYWAQDTRRFEYKWAWIPDTTAAARPTRWRRTSECLWDMKWAVWDDSLNVQTPHLGRPVNGCMSPYGCIWTRRHPWQPPDEASAKMPWFRSLVALRNRPPIPGVWCPCKQQCQCASCSDARAESLGLKFVVESDGADGVARLVAL
jgi:hypothetical protein